MLPISDPYARNPNVTFDSMFKDNYWAKNLRLPKEGREIPYYAPKKKDWRDDWGWGNGRG